MPNISANQSIQFFESQFRKQVAQGDFSLNPFEKAILPFVKGSVLDLGCGLGNLSIAAAQLGHTVFALDGSVSAVNAVTERAGVKVCPSAPKSPTLPMRA